MRIGIVLGLAGVAVAAVVAIVFAFAGDGGGASSATSPPVVRTRQPFGAPAATATPLPPTWIQGVDMPQTGTPILISCLDANHDGRIDGSDDPALDGLDITLVPGKACVDPEKTADFFAGVPSDPTRFNCDARPLPVLLVIVASAGSNLLQPSEGESMGELQMLNEIQKRAAERHVSTELVLTVPNIFGADQLQTSMEHWIEHDLAARLDAMPCLRAVIMGHSHGGVTVTSVTAALDERFSSRMFGVILDRTTALYDRKATEMPQKTRLLNIFQLNQGWHGVAIDQPNVKNIDDSNVAAPVAPSDGGHGIALVNHKSIDDAWIVQQQVIDGVMDWIGK